MDYDLRMANNLRMEKVSKPTYSLTGMSTLQVKVLLALVNWAGSADVFRTMNEDGITATDVDAELTNLFTVVDEAMGCE